MNDHHFWADMPDNIDDLKYALGEQRKWSANQAEELAQAEFEIERRNTKLLKTQAALFCAVFASVCLLLVIIVGVKLNEPQ